MENMQKNVFRKGLVLGIILLFVGASIIPSISGNISKINDIKDVEARTINDAIQTNEEEPHTRSITDWWTMFRHDLQHSGYSTSDAPDTNNVKWSYTTGNRVYSSPAVVDGKVYIGSYDNKVYCLDADTGDFIWNYTTGDIVVSSPAVADGKVYIGSNDKKVYCLDADTGDFIWSYTAGYWVRSSPAVADGKVYFGSRDSKFYCLDADTGDFIWKLLTAYPVDSSPAVAAGKVYIGIQNKLYCLDADTGDFIWIYAAGTGGTGIFSSPAVADGKVYFGSSGFVKKMHCLNANTGTKIWDYPTGNEVVSSPAVADGKVYFGSHDYKVYCLDADAGDFIWSYTTGDYVKSSPAVADGKVYVGSDDNKVYCLDAETGTKIWNYPTGWHVDSSPAVADGKVYIGSRDYKVYCFGSSKPTISFSDINGVTEPERHIFIKNDPPANTILKINGTASDPDGWVFRVKLKIDNGQWQDASGDIPITSWSYNWDISGVSDGQHTITVTCMDNEWQWSETVSKTVYINKMDFDGSNYGEFEPKSDSDYEENCVGVYIWNPLGDDIWIGYCNYRKYNYNMWKGFNSGITTIHSYAYTEANVVAGGAQIVTVKERNKLSALPSLSKGEGFTVGSPGWYTVKWPDYVTSGKLRIVDWAFDEPFVGWALDNAEAKGQYSTFVRVADTTNTPFMPAPGPKEKGIGEELGVILIDIAAIGMDESEALERIGSTLGIIGDANSIISFLEYLKILGKGSSIPYVGLILSFINWGIMIWEGINAEQEQDYKTENANPTITINNKVWLEPGKTYMPVFQIDPLYSRSKAPAGIFGVASTELKNFKTDIGEAQIVYEGSNLPGSSTKLNVKKNINFKSLSTVRNSSDAIIVDDEGDGDFTSIQDAIDNASVGDTIEVYSGTYYENITINKTINLTGIPIELGNGTDVNNPTINPYPPLNRSEYFSAMEITADNCNISGFNITFTKQVGFTAITLDCSSNNNITDVNLSKNDIGIRLINASSNNRFLRIFLMNNTNGIIIKEYSNNNTFVNNTVVFSDNGIILENSLDNGFQENIVTFCSSGTSIIQSINNTFSGNVYFFNLNSISLTNSSNHNISSNYISASVYNGILLADASHNQICNNIFSYQSGISLIGDSNNLIIQGNIISENISGTRASRPICYYFNEQNITVPSDAGQVILVNCTNFTLTGLNLSNTDFGVQLQSSSNITITNCYIANNTHGIQLIDSPNNVISNCTISNNTLSGVEIHSSSKLVVTNATNSSVNISIDHTGSTNNTISNCIISNNTAGVVLHSPFNTIIDNTFQNDGISLSAENDFDLTNFSISTGDNITIQSIQNNTISFTMQTIQNNTVDGRPIYYYSNQEDFTVPTDAGQIILANCSNFTIEDVNISNVEIGIQLAFSKNGTIVENNVTNCTTGIAVRYSSVNNTIYHNHFMNNTINAYDNCTNTWDNGSGGNYWDGYGGVDADGDGIGDTPYNISGGSNQDRYPLGYFTNNVPVANFTYSPTSPTTADVIQFNDTSYDVNGSIDSWHWEFGDGSTSIHPNPYHQYADDGTYAVNLTVADEHDISNSTQKTVVVFNAPPFADFLYGPLNPTANETIYFTDFSYDLDGAIVNWTWDFGDGDVSYEQHPTRNYTSADNYSVTLTVTDDDGENDSISKEVFDTTLPEISNIQARPAQQGIGGYVNISAVVRDNIDVDEVYLYVEYPDSSVENLSITQNKTGDTYYCNKTYSQVGTHTYHIWANDTSGNANVSADYTFEIINNPPNTPSDPNPPNGATDVDVDADLYWTGGDPDPGDIVTYDVYFGGSSPPSMVVNNQSATVYDPGTMNYNTEYFWKIVAWDNHGAYAEGPIWEFATKEVPEPDLNCDGSLGWTNVKPGETVTGSFTVENIGEPNSELDWEVTEWPIWGTWTFTPISGDDLTPEEGPVTVQVSVVAPNEPNEEFSGDVKIVNKENSNDYEIIPVYLSTPVNQELSNSQALQLLRKILRQHILFMGLLIGF